MSKRAFDGLGRRGASVYARWEAGRRWSCATPADDRQLRRLLKRSPCDPGDLFGNSPPSDRLHAPQPRLVVLGDGNAWECMGMHEQAELLRVWALAILRQQLGPA